MYPDISEPTMGHAHGMSGVITVVHSSGVLVRGGADQFVRLGGVLSPAQMVILLVVLVWVRVDLTAGTHERCNSKGDARIKH